DPAVGAEQVVAGMRIAERDAVAIEQTEVEAEDDLAIAVALVLIEPADRLEALAHHVVGDQHAPRREVGPHARHRDERVPAEQALDAPLMLRLQLVVELLAD